MHIVGIVVHYQNKKPILNALPSLFIRVDKKFQNYKKNYTWGHPIIPSVKCIPPKNCGGGITLF